MLTRLWNRWWFAPIPAGPLGLTRIAFGALVIAYIGLLLPERMLWFSETGILTSAQSDMLNNFDSNVPRIDILHGSFTATELNAFFAVFLVLAICFTVGLWTRASAVGVWLCLLSLHNRNNAIHNSGDTVMMVMAGYFALSEAGAACSLDRLRALWRSRRGDAPKLTAPWAQRLMQMQIATVYLCTSFSKLTGERWRNGTAAYYPLHLPDSRRFPVPWVDAQHLWFIHLLTYGAISVELAMWSLVWFPRLRLWVLGSGVLLHLGIEYSLNIPLFSSIMIAMYGVFLTEADWGNFVRRLQEPLSRFRLRMVFDGECDFCRSSLLVLRFFDTFGLITFLDSHIPEELAQASVVTPAQAEGSAWAVNMRNQAHPGFYCFRTALKRLPALWAIVPLLYLPGVPWLGRRAYAWVVINRGRLPVAWRYRL